MKVFKVTTTIISYLIINPQDPVDLEAWSDAITEDGTYDTELIADMIDDSGFEDLERDSSSIAVEELNSKEAAAYLDGQ